MSSATASDRASTKGRGGLTREDIVAAALEIVEAEDLGELSMRRVAAAVGAGTMTLYWYIADRDELVARVADAAFADIELAPVTAPWREQVTRLCHEFRQVVAGHRSLVPVIAQGPFGPNLLHMHNRLVASFRRSGLPDHEAANATLAVGALTQGFAFGQAMPLEPEERRRVVLDGHGPLSTLSPDEYPDLVALGDELLEGDEEAHFTLALDALLDGIEARLPSRS